MIGVESSKQNNISSDEVLVFKGCERNLPKASESVHKVSQESLHYDYFF